MSKVIEFFAGWEDHNKLLVSRIEPLTQEQLDWKPADRNELWSLRMLACHIVAARAWWWKAWMDEGDDDLARLVTMDDESEAERPDAATICAALNKSWGDIKETLARWTEDDLTAKFQRPVPRPDGTRPWRDRRYIIWHVAEHDVHHGGEISLILGIHGEIGLDM
jgi:uncharacterized damage-inducible protein DinB